jgi:AraC-like DNA-binding protein
MGQPTVRHGFGNATVSITGPEAIPAVLRALGSDPTAAFAEARVDPALFDDPGSSVYLAALGRLVKLCVARTGCQHFGLRFGQRNGLPSLGLAGLLVKHSPDVGTALRRLGSHMHLHRGGAITAVGADGDAAMLSYEIYQRNVEAVDQIGDGALAELFNIMRALCGPDWQPVEVRFAHRKPADVGPFRRFFRAPLRFDAEENALVFSADWLERRLPAADPELQRLLRKQIDALAAEHGEKFPEQVRSVLRAALLTDHSSADRIAALFSIHSRTLSRRLQAFGTGFQQLVDEGRFEIARQRPANTLLDVGRIAASLDYADASAFTRAFRRWSGTTPAQWRAKRC